MEDFATLTQEGVASLLWQEHPQNPLLSPPWCTPLLADPTFLPPEETPDRLFHLFAHSLFGIHHFTSINGVRWQRHPGIVVKNALRAHLIKDNGRFYLSYEKCRLFNPFGRWSSHIEVMASSDLWRFERPRVLLRPTLSWHKHERFGEAVSNPCLLRDEQGFRLYYSASLVRVPDCGFNEPAYIGLARSPSLEEAFVPQPEPLLRPEPADPQANLGAGAAKVFRVRNGFVAFQNGISWDVVARRSASAIRLLGSFDGEHFRPLLATPIIAPTSGWRASHVYALDVRRVGPTLFLYFNGRTAAHWLWGREQIGLATATLPSSP